MLSGSIDPWHALSVLRNLSSTETSIFINGTSHCANMGSDRKTDPPALRIARKVRKLKFLTTAQSRDSITCDPQNLVVVIFN